MVLLLAFLSTTLGLTWKLGDPSLQPYPDPHPPLFPDSAFSVIDEAGQPGKMMFWTGGGITFRVASNSTVLFPSNKPSPTTVVLGPGLNGTYDADGNWLVHVSRMRDGSLVGFTRSENHDFKCGGTGLWRTGSVVQSYDDGVSWTRSGLAVSNEQPCQPYIRGSTFSCVLPNSTGTGFFAYDGCTSYRSGDERGIPGSWFRYFDGHFGPGFTEPGIDGMSSCLPGLRDDVVSPIVHYNTFLKRYIMLYTSAKNNNTLFISSSNDGVQWDSSYILVQLPDSMSIFYGQVFGDKNATIVGQQGTLVYGTEPPSGPYLRDFLTRSIQFSI